MNQDGKNLLGSKKMLKILDQLAFNQILLFPIYDIFKTPKPRSWRGGFEPDPSL